MAAGRLQGILLLIFPLRANRQLSWSSCLICRELQESVRPLGGNVSRNPYPQTTVGNEVYVKISVHHLLVELGVRG